tara:strand:+ start:523 stop:921 length:399 start_codon:yes stop_codon:yes gene_type:complete
MKQKYGQMASGGLSRAQSTLDDVKPIQGNIKKINVDQDQVNDLAYLMRIKGDTRKLFREKYDRVINNPYFDELGVQTPGFDSIYKGKGKFLVGETSMGLKDLNAYFTFQSLLDDPENISALNIPLGRKKGGK